MHTSPTPAPRAPRPALTRAGPSSQALTASQQGTQRDSAGGGEQQQFSFQLDLKGVLYSAAVLPLAGTAMVLNIGAAEAKVCAAPAPAAGAESVFGAAKSVACRPPMPVTAPVPKFQV